MLRNRLVNLHDTRNMKTTLWALLLAAGLARWRVRGDIAPQPGAAKATALIGPVAVAVSVYGLLLIPLVTAVWRLATSGDYVAVHIHWLSSAAGVDAATFLLGHPLHTWWWRPVQHIYSAFGIGMIENSGWIGIVPLGLLATAAYRVRDGWRTSPWTAIGCAALLWSLGPFLTIAGYDTGLILPQAILRYVPVLSNARMPGRAFVLVELAVAMACAASVIHLKLRSGVVLGIAGLVLLDSVTLPISLDEVRLPRTVEQTLGDNGRLSGAVLELPIGVGDGSGEIGKLDFRMLSSQMWHGRPLVGGFAGRVPDRIKNAYLNDPVFGPLFRLSSGEIRDASAVDWPLDASARLLTIGIRFLVINRDIAPPALVAAALTHINMRPLAADGPRELYILEERPQ